MPNYKLGVTTKGTGRIIELEKIIKVKKLDDLDKFTMKFDSEDTLKAHLYKNEIIDYSEFKKKINVYYQNNGKLKHIPVFYKDMLQYLDIYYIRGRIKSLCNDFKFLEELANHYDNGKTTYNKQGLNVNDIRMYLSDVRRNGGHHFETKLLSQAIDDLIMKATCRIDPNTGEYKEDYRGLRDLALFLYKYNLKLEKIKLEEIKKQNEESQLSFFDIIDNNSTAETKVNQEDDDDYEEPLFPPNSEEEARYLRYLEDLEKEAEKKYCIEENPHYRR